MKPVSGTFPGGQIPVNRRPRSPMQASRDTWRFHQMDTQYGRRSPVRGRAPDANGGRTKGSDTMNPADALSLTEEVRKSIRVLIVDDEHTLRESCASVLTLDGFAVSVCGNGHEALTMLKRRQFDIVLLDLHMSQVSGMDLLGACLEANPDAIAIIMTGNPSVGSSIEALRAGAWDY